MEEDIRKIMLESVGCKAEFMNESRNIEKATHAIISCFKKGKKVLVFGNGGSAADAQHIAGELVGKFKLERKGLPVIALTTDSSILTSISNDVDYSRVFERQVEALAKEGDVLIGISTSGMSKNIIGALKKGKEIGCVNISLTGNSGGEVGQVSEININSPSKNTPRIQECHILAYHTICELVEKEMSNFVEKKDVKIIAPTQDIRNMRDNF